MDNEDNIINEDKREAGSDHQNKQTGESIEKPKNQPIVVSNKNNSLGLMSLIAGILSLLTISCCGPLAFIAGIAAIILGIIARGEDQEYATIGIILGSLGIAIPLILLVFVAGFSLFIPLFNLF